MPGTQLVPADMGMDADQVPPATQRVKDLPSAAQFQSPVLQVPDEPVDGVVLEATGAAAEVAADAAGELAAAAGEEAAADGLDTALDAMAVPVAAPADGETVAKPPPTD